MHILYTRINVHTIAVLTVFACANMCQEGKRDPSGWSFFTPTQFIQCKNHFTAPNRPINKHKYKQWR